MKLSLAVATATVAAVTLTTAPAVSAQTTRIAIGSARPPQWSSFLLAPGFDYDEVSAQVGANWVPGTSPPVRVDYPATAGFLWGPGSPSADGSIAIGAPRVLTAIEQADDEQVVVAGLSEGTLVVDEVQRELAADPEHAPDKSPLRFVKFGSPQVLALRLFPAGTRVPILGYTVQPFAESQYDTDMVFGEYDLWADPPDRLWNVMADANAILGTQYVHTESSQAYKDTAVQIGEPVTNSKGGTTTTYMVPTKNLPLTQPLRDVGVPDKVVDELDKGLRPVVDAGYKRNDAKTQATLNKALDKVLTKLAKPTKRTKLTKSPKLKLPKLTLPQRITRPTTERAPVGAAWRAAAHR
jgi:hypothetical protein